MADITYVPTWSSFLYLAIVLALRQAQGEGVQPACGRLVDVDDIAGRLVLAALDMSLAVRKPRGVIHHSDQGSQHILLAFGRRCREMGVRPSIGSVGDAYDNTMAESFFATLECELLARHRF